MTSLRVQQALAHASDTLAVEIGRGVLSHTGALVRDVLCSDDESVFLVADEKTWAAAGERAAASLRDAGVELDEPLIFPGAPTLYASYDHVGAIRERIGDAVPLAVGSGTLNDLVKRAAGERERRYAVVGTAASMDGYSGFGAPITVDGVKITLPCPAPAVVVLDTDVCAAAPTRMVAAGYADLLAKIPAGADWILADAVGVEPLHQLAWDTVQGEVLDALSRPQRLVEGDSAAFDGLLTGLVMSGLAMQIYQDTRPASGAEHYFSHIWEMAGLGAHDEPPLSHGFKVGIGTLTVAAFYERLLERDLRDIDIDARVATWPSWDEVEAQVRSVFTGNLADNAVAETRAKYVEGDALRARLTTLADQWPQLRRRCDDQVLPAATLQDMLRYVGAPTIPEDIGLDADDVRATFPQAMFYRSRYTCLDVAREFGLFDELVDELFDLGGFWG